MQNRPLPANEPLNPTLGETMSGMSWAAIFGGSTVAIAVSLMLLILGSALGLSSMSPWSHSAADAAGFTAKVAIWLIVMQWIAAALGGYVTGRLRTKWVGMHVDEVFFRDTAHGFITWSVATLFAATVLASATASFVSNGAHAVAFLSAGAGNSMKETEHGSHNPAGVVDYYVDKLLRVSPSAALQPTVAPIDHEVKAEIGRILVLELKNDHVSDEDKQYLAQVVVARTGASPADASKRIEEVLGQIDTFKTQAQDKANEARKMSMKVSLYIFISMLIGAFIASAAAALGGVQRDEY